ncbi:20 kDa chloroplastic [Micractinium conductrix]|uniref:20 kDa chaperonin, chloroplastic n=1 Tax=Micractinium conductrix TaxID=554055 RepID=A0A2P6VA27_9CHLO|nr:20 kDa chloroplastic [Micractinium conductrix]|eukprot:PSC70946.1 20 kDa chloroplastic [Micractinium conductrix]
MSAITCTRAPVAPAAVARLPARRAQRLVVRAATALPAEVKTVSPVGDRVLVKAEEAEAKTVGGILLPSSAQKRPTQGTVSAAGSAKAVKAGDKVVYSKYAGTELEVQGDTLVLLKEDDVIGLLSGGDDISKLQPLQDRVLIEVVEAKASTAGGLLLTEGSKEKPTMGKVVAVGPGREEEDGKSVKPKVEVGATVLYQKYSGTEFEGANDKQYIVVRDMDIMAQLA